MAASAILCLLHEAHHGTNGGKLHVEKTLVSVIFPSVWIVQGVVVFSEGSGEHTYKGQYDDAVIEPKGLDHDAAHVDAQHNAYCRERHHGADDAVDRRGVARHLASHPRSSPHHYRAGRVVLLPWPYRFLRRLGYCHPLQDIHHARALSSFSLPLWSCSLLRPFLVVCCIN